MKGEAAAAYASYCTSPQVVRRAWAVQRQAEAAVRSSSEVMSAVRASRARIPGTGVRWDSVKAGWRSPLHRCLGPPCVATSRLPSIMKMMARTGMRWLALQGEC